MAATVNGDKGHGGALSFLPGQRLSRCTCPNVNDGGQLIHPGPMHSDGTFVGRAAPEIDIFEAQIGGTPKVGEVSQSAQWAVGILLYSCYNRLYSLTCQTAFQRSLYLV